MSKTISLGKNNVAIVDDCDFELLSQWKWRYRKKKENNAAYALRHGDCALMHRVILGAPAGIQVDHRDGDGLNNQRSNLRCADNAQNQWNRGPQKNNTSGHKGVDWHARKERWRARIMVNGKHVHLGYFHEVSDAAAAYGLAANMHHGEYARVQ